MKKNHIRVIKRYSNRKLYDTQEKSYITLHDIASLIREGEEIQIIENETGEDLTPLTLTQILFEEEKRTRGIMPRSILTGLIQAGEDKISALQRSLFTTLNFRKQVDLEIVNRIGVLVNMGYLSETEGQELIDKMMGIGLEYHIVFQQEQERQLSLPKLQNLLGLHHIPSRDDLQKLQEQINELSEKIEDLFRQEKL